MIRSKKFDLVLVVEYFRSVNAYLSVIKGLKSEFSIGIYEVPQNDSYLRNNDTSQVEFLNMCQDLGATIIKSEKVETKVLMLPQRPLSNEAILDIKKTFDAKTTVLLLGFAYAGIEQQDEILKHFNFKKAYAVDMDFLSFLAEKREAKKLYSSIDITEVGLPFKKYPVCDDFSADYILAIPTMFSFYNESDKWSFLESVRDIFNLLDSSDVIVHKPHNGSEIDQFSSLKARSILKYIKYFPAIRDILKFNAKYFPLRKIRRDIAKLYTAYLYDIVLGRTITMNQAGGSPYIALEAYIAGVKKGIIGGTSNTMWGTLFFKLPFYNCVDLAAQDREHKDKLYGKHKSEKMWDLNLQYFMVPYCKGRLEFNEALWEIPSKGSRSGDLVDELRKEIGLCIESAKNNAG